MLGPNSEVRLASDTSAEKPLFLRQHLLDVHNCAVDTLKEGEVRLVSLVGCPGTGKTWCGWLVAYTLQQMKIATLHLTFRGKSLSAVSNLSEQSTYDDPERFTYAMFKELINQSRCTVCILDVGDLPFAIADSIFRSMRTLLEQTQASPNIKFMALHSGHGEELILGKLAAEIQRQMLVLWSWTQQEFDALCASMEAREKNSAPSPNAYAVCGGSVRHLFRVDDEKGHIYRAAQRMNQDEMERFLRLEFPTASDAHKQRTSLLAFYAEDGESNSFQKGMAYARIVPRSDYVLQCVKNNEFTDFRKLKQMYVKLLDINPGAAGTVFEQLVSLFWKEATKSQSKFQLQLRKSHDDEAPTQIEIDCQEVRYQSRFIEDAEWQHMAIHDLPLGYFVPSDPYHPDVDSLLRYKIGDEEKVLCIQVSIAKKHGCKGYVPETNLMKPMEEGERPKLAMWDCPIQGLFCRKCEWAGESKEWDRCYIRCEEFETKMVSPCT